MESTSTQKKRLYGRNASLRGNAMLAALGCDSIPGTAHQNSNSSRPCCAVPTRTSAPTCWGEPSETGVEVSHSLLAGWLKWRDRRSRHRLFVFVGAVPLAAPRKGPLSRVERTPLTPHTPHPRHGFAGAAASVRNSWFMWSEPWC